MDAFLSSNDTHMELCRALKTSGLRQCPFKIHLSKLDLSCFGVARIRVMLEQVDPQVGKHANGKNDKQGIFTMSDSLI